MITRFIYLAALACIARGWALPLNSIEARGIDASLLVKAPQIVVGRVISEVRTGRTIVLRGSPIEVNISKALVKVSHVLKGEAKESNWISNLVTPVNSANDFGRQILEEDKTYVFFLQRAKSGSDWLPISPLRFALEVKQLPKDTSGDFLHHIAEQNIDSVDNFVAASWARFLQEISTPDDAEFWEARVNDHRMTIRGIALIAVVGITPGTSEICSKVLAYLNDAGPLPEQWRNRKRLSELLPGIVGKEPPADVLRELLGNSAKEAKEEALQLIRIQKHKGLILDIEREMYESKDIEIQYQCLKTLCSIENRQLISFTEFSKEPARYIGQRTSDKTRNGN